MTPSLYQIKLIKKIVYVFLQHTGEAFQLYRAHDNAYDGLTVLLLNVACYVYIYIYICTMPLEQIKGFTMV